MPVIAGPVVERDQLDLTLGLQIIRFAPDHPEGVRVTQESGRYRLSGQWETQGIQLYTRMVPGVSYPHDQYCLDFTEKLYQVAPGFLATQVALRINHVHLTRRPVHFYVREPSGFPSGSVVWEDPYTEGATWMLTVETLGVTER